MNIKFEANICPECGRVLTELVEDSEYFCSFCDKAFDGEGNEINIEDKDPLPGVPWRNDD